MAAVLSHLHHSALSQPWGIRVAAVQAIAKVAVRSEEPYKLQGYTILKSLSAPDYISDPDATGELSGCLSVMYTHACMRLLASHSHGSVPVLLAALGRTTQHSYVFAHTLDAHPCLPPPLSSEAPNWPLLQVLRQQSYQP